MYNVKIEFIDSVDSKACKGLLDIAAFLSSYHGEEDNVESITICKGD